MPTDILDCLGRRVALSAFHGLSVTPPNTKRCDDYWKLIGLEGRIVGIDVDMGMPKHPSGQRVLVQFSRDVESFGLACHNEVPNSLWLFISDLVLL